MEEKKQIKISFKIAIIFILIAIFIIGGSLIILNISNYSSYRNGNSITICSSFKTKPKGKEVDYIIKTGCYIGTANCIENTFVSSYNEFERYINNFGQVRIGDKNVLEIFDKEFFKNNTLAIEAHDEYSSHNLYKINSVKVTGTEVNINIDLTTYSHGGDFAPTVEFNFIVLDNNVKSAKFNINTRRVNNTMAHEISDKPIIYLYPSKDMDVSIKLGYKENITVSYPKYVDGWHVFAQKDGTLTDLSTNRKLYALYYECENRVSFKEEKEGFVVKGEDSAKFLEEKLAALGLNEREAEEFIIYWLPKLENNKYNYIRFATDEEINKNMPLEINTNPDTIIRVLMTFKGLENPIEVEEQKLDTPERKGFTVVEWGGTEIK